MNAAKGLAFHSRALYVSGIDRLVAVDVDTGEIVGTWDGKDANFLNGVAADDRLDSR